MVPRNSCCCYHRCSCALRPLGPPNPALPCPGTLRPCPGVLPCSDVFLARPRPSMPREQASRDAASIPLGSTSGQRTYGSPPPSGAGTLQLPDPTTPEVAFDFEPVDSEDERLAAEEPSSVQASSPPAPWSMDLPPFLRRLGRLFSSTGPPLRGMSRGSRRNAWRSTRPTS